MGAVPGIIFGSYAIDITRFAIYWKGDQCQARPKDVRILISLISLSGEDHRAVYGHEIPELAYWRQNAANQNKHLRQSVDRLRDLGEDMPRYIVTASKNDPSKKGAYLFAGSARPVADLITEYPYPLRMPFPRIARPLASYTTLLSDKERKVVREIAESLNMEEVALVRKVAEHMTPKKHLELLEFKRRQSAIRQKRINNQLLGLYYDKDLAKHSLCRYSICVNGKKTITPNIVVSSDWLNLRIDLEDQRDRFKVVDPFPYIPSLKLEEVADLVASSFLLGIRISNEPVFCLRDINPAQSGSPISFSIGQYFEHRLSHGKLGSELMHALIASKLNPDKAITEQPFDRRKSLLDAGSIKSFSARRSVGGVNVLVAFQQHDDFVFFVKQRSDEVASAPGEFCILPNGFHQSLTKAKVEQQVSIRESSFRELGEELFNREQVIRYDGHNEPDWYYEYPQLHWFTEKKNKNDFEHLWVCFGSDLTDGSYQFGVLLVIRNPQYLERFRQSIWPNYEFRRNSEPPLEISTKNPGALATVLTNRLCADTSVFTIVEGLRALKALDKRRVVLPDIELVTAA